MPSLQIGYYIQNIWLYSAFREKLKEKLFLNLCLKILMYLTKIYGYMHYKYVFLGFFQCFIIPLLDAINSNSENDEGFKSTEVSCAWVQALKTIRYGEVSGNGFRVFPIFSTFWQNIIFLCIPLITIRFSSKSSKNAEEPSLFVSYSFLSHYINFLRFMIGWLLTDCLRYNVVTGRHRQGRTWYFTHKYNLIFGELNALIKRKWWWPIVIWFTFISV